MPVTTIIMNQLRKTIRAVYTNEVPPIPEVTNPDCGENIPGTYSEFFRNKYQFQESGHAGARYRCKFVWPTAAVTLFGVRKHSDGPCTDKKTHLTCADNITRVYRGETWELLAACPIYAIDGGDAGIEGMARPDAEWFDPIIGVPVRVELWRGGKPVMRVRLNDASASYQGPLKDRI